MIEFKRRMIVFMRGEIASLRAQDRVNSGRIDSQKPADGLSSGKDALNDDRGGCTAAEDGLFGGRYGVIDCAGGVTGCEEASAGALGSGIATLISGIGGATGGNAAVATFY